MESKSAGILRLNGSIEHLLQDASRREQLERDWVGAAVGGVDFNADQRTFIQGLPPRSVQAIQEIVRSVLKSGGRMYFQLDEQGDAEFFADHSPVGEGPIEPLRVISVKICKFDANFQNCKWFWQS